MADEIIFEPDLKRIQDDEYYLFYEMLMQALKTDDVKKGVNKSLSLLRIYLSSGNIVLFKKNDCGIYINKVADSKMNDVIKTINYIVNRVYLLAEKKEIFDLDLNISDDIKNILLIYFKINDADCIVAINSYDKSKKLEPLFLQKVRDTIQIIMKRALSYEKNIKAINTDLLTGLNNRNAYEMRLQSFNELDNDLVVGLFDLFRLKYVNDNYGHFIGDIYIKKVAGILNKYWPQYNSYVLEDGTEKKNDTGHYIYRIGGDEFVLMTKEEKIDLVKIKADLAQEEVNMIKLPVDDTLHLGLNYGVVLHKSGDSFKQTFSNADNLMTEDKKKMYLKYGIERRK